MTKSIDIIFCYKNKEIARVKNSLDSLLLQSVKSFRVVFIDYGSDDNFAFDAERLCKNYPFCNYYYINTKGQMWNRADALNHGFRLSTADFIFTSDIDMVYKKNFISFLHNLSNNELMAYFFAVGYLGKKQVKKIDVNELDKFKYTLSKSYALGMMFASKKIIEQIDGYNSFYAIWGVEDNDIKKRIEVHNFKTTFIDNEVLMLHQYHPPSNTLNSNLPQGWKQYLKDYYHDFFNNQVEFNGLKQIILPKKRPSLDVFNDKSIIAKQLQGRNLFIRHLLFNDIIISQPHSSFKYQIDLSTYPYPENSSSIKVIKLINAFFLRIKIPIKLSSSYNEQFLSKKEAYDEIYFFLKSMENTIEDYFLHDQDDRITLVVVKK